MKKSYILIAIFIIFIISISIVGTILVTGKVEVKEEMDILAIQANKEVYFTGYGYDTDNPNIIVNPYGNSPLTAIVMFETNSYEEVSVIVKSKDGNSDISNTFKKSKYHIIPIYGLYADYENSVVIRVGGKDRVISIKTEKLPDDFKLEVNGNDTGKFVFYNTNYPYAVDTNGEVRWFLKSNLYGEVEVLDNSRIVVGSDKYREDGNTASFYEMDLLGKIYNEYLLPEGYYGKMAVYEDDFLILSDRIILVDSQNGKVIKGYGDNKDYDYLDAADDEIVVRREGVFYRIKDGKEENIEYVEKKSGYDFYRGDVQYNVVTSNRFGELGETLPSKKSVSLLNYDKGLPEGVSISLSEGRLEIVSENDDSIYAILDKFLDKRVYEVNNIRYINMSGLNGKYTIYFKVKDKVYKTDYYVEV